MTEKQKSADDAAVVATEEEIVLSRVTVSLALLPKGLDVGEAHLREALRDHAGLRLREIDAAESVGNVMSSLITTSLSPASQSVAVSNRQDADHSAPAESLTEAWVVTHLVELASNAALLDHQTSKNADDVFLRRVIQDAVLDAQRGGVLGTAALLVSTSQPAAAGGGATPPLWKQVLQRCMAPRSTSDLSGSVGLRLLCLPCIASGLCGDAVRLTKDVCHAPWLVCCALLSLRASENHPLLTAVDESTLCRAADVLASLEEDLVVPAIKKILFHFSPSPQLDGDRPSSSLNDFSNKKVTLLRPEHPEHFFSYAAALENDAIRVACREAISTAVSASVDGRLKTYAEDLMCAVFWWRAIDVFAEIFCWTKVVAEASASPRLFLHHCNVLSDAVRGAVTASSPEIAAFLSCSVVSRFFSCATGRSSCEGLCECWHACDDGEASYQPVKLWCGMQCSYIASAIEGEEKKDALWRREFIDAHMTDRICAPPGPLVTLFRGLYSAVEMFVPLLHASVKGSHAGEGGGSGPPSHRRLSTIVWEYLVVETLNEFSRRYDVAQDEHHGFIAEKLEGLWDKLQPLSDGKPTVVCGVQFMFSSL